MEAYEFYWLSPKGGYQIIGVLPERRNNPERITRESILRWGRNIFGQDFYMKDTFFIKVTIDKRTVRVFQPVPFTIPQKDL